MEHDYDILDSEGSGDDGYESPLAVHEMDYDAEDLDEDKSISIAPPPNQIWNDAESFPDDFDAHVSRNQETAFPLNTNQSIIDHRRRLSIQSHFEELNPEHQAPISQYQALISQYQAPISQYQATFSQNQPPVTPRRQFGRSQSFNTLPSRNQERESIHAGSPHTQEPRYDPTYAYGSPCLQESRNDHTHGLPYPPTFRSTSPTMSRVSSHSGRSVASSISFRSSASRSYRRQPAFVDELEQFFKLHLAKLSPIAACDAAAKFYLSRIPIRDISPAKNITQIYKHFFSKPTHKDLAQDPSLINKVVCRVAVNSALCFHDIRKGNSTEQRLTHIKNYHSEMPDQ
ncbi:hypothetical protein BGX26_006034 [Mortierella sp. AD094]|nr:hypothetical protein BGX26_006034 [Mortierella sp. AD094]